MEFKKCAVEDCNAAAVGKSKYCATHRAESRARFKAMCAEQGAAKAEREARFAAAWAEARMAGRAAGIEATPPKYLVKDDLTGHVYKDAIEICGFAWLKVSPGNCAFANWLKKQGHADKAYGGGVQVWIGDFGQSYDRKVACAEAMARVLKVRVPEAQVYAAGRLD